ncbi:SAM-dependent methyltransferase, partial [Burkholderia territorii]|uniref:SAM-dependent methyltransferase n=1 Tax=Burkholderia territorii TaxID=1503055 RepID=UPI002011196D
DLRNHRTIAYSRSGVVQPWDLRAPDGSTVRIDMPHQLGFDDVPGVTATAACAATLGVELTLPGVAQTVILTRFAGKTTMPEGEALGALAAHRATLAIHLGVRHLARIVDEVLPHYGAACPVAVIYRASWPDEERVTGTLADIVDKVQGTRIERTALILIGRVLDAEGFADSTLYASGS